MISNLILYVIVGVGFNFIYDHLVNYTSEEHRFTLLERFIVVAIWPLVVLFFVGYGLKSFLKNFF
jgi:hypothetical protein